MEMRNVKNFHSMAKFRRAVLWRKKKISWLARVFISGYWLQLRVLAAVVRSICFELQKRALYYSFMRKSGKQLLF